VWRHAVWESVVASQAAAHFSRQELANLADVYNLVQRGEAISGAELDAWSDLSTMVGPGRRLDPASEAELRRALSRARTYNRTLTAISSILMAQARGLKLPFSTSDLGLIDANRRTSLSQDAATPSNPYPMNLCGPIGAAAAHYGQSTLGTLPKFLDGSGKQLEGYTASLKQASP
jgi:predicted nucleic acid-binding protein